MDGFGMWILIKVSYLQAYGFGAGVEDEESEGGRSEGGGSEGVMDCEPTVAYHVGGEG